MTAGIKSIVIDPEQHARFKIEAAKRRIKLRVAATQAIQSWIKNHPKE